MKGVNVMNLRISGIVEESIVDGEGIRFVIFTQGCPHHCKGCHNPSTHDFSGGRIVTIDEVFSQIKGNPLLSGVTFSGGEPFCQPKPLIELAKRIHQIGLNIWSYTGYTLEQLMNMGEDEKKLLHEVDFLVDGKFILEEKDLSLPFRGSRNQRILNLPKMRKEFLL